VLLDFHYSDIWADPGKQEIPEAWKNITDINDLVDSVYNYTFKTLNYLNGKNLMPEFVQIGNEINCGMLYTNASADFPKCNGCEDNWKNLGDVINGGIAAVRDVANASDIKTKVILHVADPKNVEWWFDNIKANGQVTDFEIIGFSFYPLWHTTVSIGQLSDNVTAFKSKYGKEVMILETAYPWTTQVNDSYNNLFGSQSPYPGYPYTQKGQLEIMKEMTREVMIGGGYGIIYWEPAWITSEMKDLWGTGSAWENNAFFDYDGSVTDVIDFMNYDYNQ
jgi:arabinogalactan endo-1,4-beta-galactosidase